MLTLADLDAACAPLAQQLRLRGDIPAAELDAAVPGPDATGDDWLRFHGQLHRWLAAPSGAPVAAASDHAAADARILEALSDTPVPVEGTSLLVYPKSFVTLMHIAALDVTLDGLTRLYATCTTDEASAVERDQVERIGAAIAYTLGLVTWAWTTPGPGLPWDVSDGAPVLPAHIEALRPDETLTVHQAVATMHLRLAALQQLVDPVRAEDGGNRPSWSALFHGLGVELGVGADVLLAKKSLDAVLAMARLEVARNAPPPKA